MRLAFLTPGTGSYYCGACMRDNALAKSLLEAGHEVSMLPMYLPLQLDEASLTQRKTPIFFGGINIYLQQKVPLFRRSPAWFDRLFNSSSLLRAAANRSHMTSPREHGEMALAMLEIEDSPFAKETAKLLDWLTQDPPDLVVLSNALLAGFIRPLKDRLGCSVMTCFQGEDSFLDGLPEPYRERCWNAMRARLAETDLLVSPSRFYADLMRERLGDPELDIAVMPNGVEAATGQSGARDISLASASPIIGYLARMIPEKGLHLLVEAFIHLRKELGHPDARLHIAGACTAADEQHVARAKTRLSTAGLSSSVAWSANIDHPEKTRILSSFTLCSVPATYPEAFGLYTVEALAAGVPLVLPDRSSFTEIVGQSRAGVLTRPDDPASLAQAWHDLLSDPERLQELRTNALRASEESYSVRAMRDRFLELATPLISPGR